MKLGITAFVACLLLTGFSIAQQPEKFDAQKHKEVVARAITFLKEKGQDREDGSYSKQVSPAVTALCAYAMMRNGVPADDRHVVQALEYVKQFVKPDGGVYHNQALTNYETSIAILAFVEANKEHRYDETIKKATDYLKVLQWDEGEGHDHDSDFYGGQGYGSGKRPDLSNTAFFIDALKATGEDPESPALQRARVFLSRCQNLASKDNVEDFAAKATPDEKGGFIYSPANGGESKAVPPPAEGGLRSYGSMTYAGLKSFIHAGVKKDDMRVLAATDWIRRHYDLKSNPGMGEQGLYYYYMVFAKALDALGEVEFADSNGVKHNWRADMVNELAARQRSDGSWANSADRWFEGDANLVTAYALLALSHTTATQANGK
jgi:squalene-hopene/tetraprenyl-beta-curcumene cyclase